MSRARINANLVLLLALSLILTSGGTTGSAAPFALPEGVPMAAAVILDGSPEADQKLTSAQAKITTDTADGSARKVIQDAGGEFRLVTKPPGEYEKDWVKAAYGKKGSSTPWIVAAGPHGGVNEAVPANVDADKLVSKLKAISGK